MIYCQENGIVTGCKQIVEVVRLSNQAIIKQIKISNKEVHILNYYTGGDTIRVCLFCLSTEFGVDESALFVRLHGVFNSTLITLSESKKVTISSLIFVQPSTLIWTHEESVLSNNDFNTFPCFVNNS
jgi:hypothetical protein